MKYCFSFILLFVLSISFGQEKGLQTVVQKGHGEVVKAVQYSSDGMYVVTASRDKTAKLWDAESGMEIRSFLGHQHTVNDVVFSFDEKKIATSSADNTAKVWDVLTGKSIWTSPKSKEYTTTISFHPNGKWLAVGGYDNQVIIYDFSKGDTVASIKVNPDKGMGYGVQTLFSDDGKYFSIGEDNRLVSVYNVKDWSLKYSFQPNKGWCGGCASISDFHPKYNVLLKASRHSELLSYDLNTGEIIQTFKADLDDVVALEYNKKGEKLLYASEDSVFVFNATNGKLIAEFKPDVKNINSAVFHPLKELILIGGDDNEASVWDFKGKKIVTYTGVLNRGKGNLTYDATKYREQHIANYIKHKNKLYLSNDASFLIKGKLGKKVRMWEVNSGKTIMEFVGHEKPVISFAVSKDESTLITADDGGALKLWDIKTGKLKKSYSGHRAPVFDVQLSNDETKFVSVSWDGYVVVWDVETGEKLSKIYLGNVSAYNVDFSPNDVYLILGKLDKTLELWEIDSGKLVRSFIGHTEIVTGIEWLKGGDSFLSIGKDGYTVVWDLKSGLINQKIRQHGSVNAVLSWDDKIINGGEDRTIRVYDLKTGKVIKQLEGHQAGITALNINEDKNLLVSLDVDGVIKFWKLDTFEPFFEQILIGDKDWMVKTKDGHFYATDGAMQNIHFVDGMTTFSLDQFFEEFYKPKLLPELFHHSKKENGKDIRGMLDKSPPPSLNFGLYPEKTDSHVTLQLRVDDNGGGIRKLQLFHNGKRVNSKDSNLEIIEKTNDYQVYKIESALVSGHNVFSAKAYSKLNIASKSTEIDIETVNNKPGSKCYVLSVGINEYKNPKLSLNYAKEDASSFIASIEQTGDKIFSSIEITSVYDENATQENILFQLDELAKKVQINDVFILYYAGHGSVVDDHFYFIPTEATRLYDSKLLKEQAIDAELLQEKLQSIKALKQVIIMDACQSGKSVELLAQRGAMEEKAIAQLSRSTGIHVLASAGSEQFASEFVSLGHGLFTYALLEALSGKADGAPKDGKITIYEIKSYLDDQVPELSVKYKGKPQYPYSFSRGHDFPIGAVK